MTSVVLFHSVLGLRPAVRHWADQLRAAGHTVHLPDLYDGAVFDNYADGMRHVETIGGIPALIARSQAAVAELPQDLVYAGFSNGAVAAELLALTRPDARGAILMHGALPIAALGSATWPSRVPVQVHYKIGDRFRDESSLRALATAVQQSGAPFELYDYLGKGHLFADSGLPDFDAVAASLMLDRVLGVLERVGRSRS